MRLSGFLSLLTSSVVLSQPFRPSIFDFDPAAIQSLASVKSVQTYRDSAQATFIVPSAHTDNQSFIFDFQALASNSSCGGSNLNLNGVALNENWDSAGLHALGEASIPSSDLDLNVWWESFCLSKPNTDHDKEDDRANDAQLLILNIAEVDGLSTQSRSGFTISFKQTGQPELLRLSIFPDYSSIWQPQVNLWREPPPALRIRVPEEQPVVPSNSSIPAIIEELRLLEAEAEALEDLIRLKHDYIHTLAHEEAAHLKEEIHLCDGWLCALKAIWRKAHGAAQLVYLKLRPNPHRDEVRNQNSYWRVTGGQQPTVMQMAFSEEVQSGQPLPQPPPLCYFPDGRNGTSTDEKRPFPDELPPRPPRARRPPFIVVLIKTILIITGIAAICSFIHRRFCSLRKRTDRLALQEQRRRERDYRRQARRQAFRDWWHGRRRGTPGRRPGDYDEKRDLIGQQEGVLEDAMQDEIRQLQVQEEIRQLRHTHTTVDQLVRAEEGQSRHYLQHDLQQTVASSSTHPHGFIPIPIPPRSTGGSSYVTQPPRHSRSNSLPDYTSESGMSNPPPSYKSRASAASQGEESDEDADVSSDYTPSSASSRWTPGSSIPDISPRMSMETTRTLL